MAVKILKVILVFRIYKDKVEIVEEQSGEKEAWNDFAETYYEIEQQSQLPYVTEVLEFLQQQDLLPATLLDLGCGAGRFTVPFAQLGVEVTAVDFSDKMLAILKQRVEQTKTTANIQIQQKSWQDLVRAQVQVPNLWLSMLPDVTPQQMQTISRLVTETLFIFRLVEVNDPLLTPLLSELTLPPERPEIQPELMTQYQAILQSEFTHSQTQAFNYQVTETLSEAELAAYLEDYPEMTPEKLVILQSRLQPEVKQGQLLSQLNYRFELLILQR